MKNEATLKQVFVRRTGTVGQNIRRPKNRFFQSKDQRKFLKLAVVTWGLSIAMIVIGKRTLYVNPGNWDVMGERLHFISLCLAFAALPLIAGILTVSIQRLNPRNLIGQKLRTDLPVDINRHYIRNTVEQFQLFAIAQLAMCGFVPKEDAIGFVLLTALFIIGRLIFWFGYHNDTYTRALGFGLTFYPIIGAFLWVMSNVFFGWAPHF